MPIYELNHSTPLIGKGTWVAPSADIIAEQSMVRKGAHLLPGKVYAGAPAEIKKNVTKDLQEVLDLGIEAYLNLNKLYHGTLKKLDNCNDKAS